MRTIIFVTFGCLVFYAFAWPRFVESQNQVAKLVAVAVSK